MLLESDANMTLYWRRWQVVFFFVAPMFQFDIIHRQRTWFRFQLLHFWTNFNFLFFFGKLWHSAFQPSTANPVEAQNRQARTRWKNRWCLISSRKWGCNRQICFYLQSGSWLVILLASFLLHPWCEAMAMKHQGKYCDSRKKVELESFFGWVELLSLGWQPVAIIDDSGWIWLDQNIIFGQKLVFFDLAKEQNHWLLFSSP